jgi:hypothetical protein
MTQLQKHLVIVKMATYRNCFETAVSNLNIFSDVLSYDQVRIQKMVFHFEKVEPKVKI